MATLATLVLDIQANTANLARGADQVNATLGRLETGAAKMGKVLAGAFTVTAIIGAGKQVLDFADKLSNLAAKTGISTTGLQKLELAFQGAGVSLDTVAQNTVRLSKALLDGEKGVVSTLGKLGLNLEQIKRMAPEQQFLTIADAIGNIQNPTERAYAAMEIFGKGGAELLQGLTGNLRETTNEFEQMGLIIDEETIAAADQFGDQLGVLGRQLLGVVAQIVGPLLPALSALASFLGKVGNVVGAVLRFFIDWIQKGLVAAYAAIARFIAGVADAATKIPLLGKHLGFASDAADALRKSADGADQYLVKLFTSTTQVASGANLAAPAMIGLGKATDDAGKAAKKTAQEYAALMSETRNLQQMAIFEFDAKQLEFARQIKELTTLQTPTGFRPLGQFEAMAEELRQLETTIQPGFSPEKFFERMALPPGALRTVFSGLGQTIRTQLGPTILQALTGGGDIGRSVGGLIGGSLANNLMSGNVGKAVSGALSGALGKTIGGAIGSVIPGLGTMLGSMVGPLLGKLGNLFKGMFGGPSQTELEGRAAGRQFTDTLRLALSDTQRLEASMLAAQGNSREWAESVIAIRDAYVATGRTADQALKDHARLIDAQGRGAEAVRRVAEQINQAFIEQQADAERLQKAIEKYGFSLEELGPSNQLRELHEQALDLIEDWRVLVASGIDVSLVNEKMASSVNAFLQTALKTGTEVPYAMKPILELMADQGRLTDLAGNKITDLTEAGIVFSETLTQGFDRVVQKLQQLIETLQGSGVAIEDVMISADVATRLRAAEIERFIQTQPKLPFGFSDRRNQSLIDYYTNNPDIPIPMADGGMGVVTQPTLFLAGERGPEAFAFAGAGRTSFGGGGGDTTLVFEAGSVVVQGTGRNADDIADDLVVKISDRWRRNFKGTRTSARAALGVA